MSKIIGIDLGTTNSCFAYMIWDKSEVIANAEGERTTPSIAYIKGEELMVGTLAKRKAILEPKNVVYEAKRLIGRKWSEVQDELKNIPYECKEGKDGGVLVVIDGKEYKPEQIAAFVLQKIKADAEKFLGQPVTAAVITVPAYFNDSQRNATKVAGEIAGLKVERIINEPTAAALAYGIGKMKDEKIAVFDLGGGTFDITVLEIGAEGTFQVLSTSGDTHLWGADLDKKLINWLIAGFKAKEGIDLSKNAMALQRLREEAENAKKQLSQTESVDITIPFITMGEDGQPRNIQETISRAQFNQMTEDLVNRCKKPVLDALKDAKLKPSDIDEVILVGGSTRIPAVRDLVKDIFGKEPKATVNPDEAVAAGAAIQAGIIQGDVSDILLLDVTPLSLGVEVEGGLVDVVIPRNTTIPVKKNKTYTTAVDNQPAVTIHVLQGERPMATDNKALGQFNLDGIPGMRRGEPQIEVTFDIDANGIMHVSAKEKTTGKEQKVTISGATGLSEEEIEKAQAEAAQFADEDKKKKEIIEVKNRCDAMAHQVEKFLEEAEKNKEKTPLSDEDKEKMEGFVKQATDLKADGASTKEQYEELMKQIEETLNGMYQKYGGAWNSDAATENPGAEVIEADDEPKTEETK
jgi:molecular chaperone DnaK